MSFSGILIRMAAAICLLQGPLANTFGTMSLFDDALAASMGLYLLSTTAQKRPLRRLDMLMLACLILLGLYGVTCNFVSAIPRTARAIGRDLLSTCKVFVCFLGAKYLFERRQDCEQLTRWCAFLARTIVLSGVICLPLAHMGLLDMLSSSRRFGLRCFEFIYGSPGMLSQYCVLLVTILLSDFATRGSKPIKALYFILSLILWASSLRSRALALVTITAFLSLAVFGPSIRERFSSSEAMRRLTSPPALAIIAAVALYLGRGQFNVNFGELGSARSYLLDAGLKVFWRFFPLGAGFATFGTEAARLYYSPLYTEYGLNAHWALGVDGTELTDTFWPAILAEFGAVGIVIYLVPLSIMLYQIVAVSSRERDTFLSAVIFVIYTLIASVATGVFFSPTITCCMLFVGLNMGLAGNEDKQPRRKLT